MTSKLLNIPDLHLDETIKRYIKESDEIIIVVSFILESGLNLILQELKEFSLKNKLKIITSNYLCCTEPDSLRKLLDLKSSGAEIFLFDSIKSNKSFHIKSYYFSNSSKEFSKCIVGSSNISLTAFKKGYEFNAEIEDKNFINDFKIKLKEIQSNPYTFELTEQFIKDYEEHYDKNKNFILSDEEEGKGISEASNEVEPTDITEIPYKEPNIAQQEALEILETDRELGVERGLVVMATGLGKTFLAALDAKSFDPKRLLFVAHREEILKQSMKSFRKFMPNKSYGFYQGEEKDSGSDFIFASIQTLGKKGELEKFNKEDFDYIVIDEFHHVAARSYRKLVEYFNPKFFLGLTATPNRSDNIDILQFCGNNLLYKKDLIDGVKLKLLSEFHYNGIYDKYVDYQKITFRGKKFNEEDLTKNLNIEKRAKYVFENWDKLKQTRTLAFCASIKHCDYMSKYFSNKGINAVSVHSKSITKRDEAIEKLQKKEIDILFSVDLFNEGVDIPAVDTIMMLRPTESKIIFIQQFGRGLRVANNKDFVQVIDFIGNHKSFLEKPAALFDFDLNSNEIKKFIDLYNDKKLDLPEGSRVFYDIEVINFFDKLASTRRDFVHLYNEYKDDNKDRPSASQFHQFIDRLSSVRNTYGSWFNFIDERKDLSQLESTCLKDHKQFFLILEKTRMNKCFKMVVLDIFLKNNLEAISIKELCRKSFEYLRATTNLWNETASEFKKNKLNDVELGKWEKYWVGNPINAWTKQTGNEPVFFTIENDMFDLNFSIKKDLKSSFIKLSKELVEYRFSSYKISFDLSYIERGDVSKDYQSQVHKAFSKTHVSKLFNFTGAAATEGVWRMFGHVRPSDVSHQFIFVTLIKSDMPKEHRYYDFFKSEKYFHWQSRRSTSQKNEAGLDIIKHGEIGKDIHLFVRKTNRLQGNAIPYTYCGRMKFLDVNGNNPINVNFELEKPLSEKLRQEFLRV